MLTADESLALFDAQLRAELSAFGPDFFEELEDLKYREKLFRERLQQLSTQFGVDVPELRSAGPGDPSRGARPNSAARETGVNAMGAVMPAAARPAGPGASRDRIRPKPK